MDSVRCGALDGYRKRGVSLLFRCPVPNRERPNSVGHSQDALRSSLGWRDQSVVVPLGPTHLEGRHVRLEPLTHNHLEALVAAAQHAEISTYLPINLKAPGWVNSADRDRRAPSSSAKAAIELAVESRAGGFVVSEPSQWMSRERWDGLVRGENCSLCQVVRATELDDSHGYFVADLTSGRLRLAADQHLPG